MIWGKTVECGDHLTFFLMKEGSIFSLMAALKGACTEFQEPFAPLSIPLIGKSGSPFWASVFFCLLRHNWHMLVSGVQQNDFVFVYFVKWSIHVLSCEMLQSQDIMLRYTVCWGRLVVEIIQNGCQTWNHHLVMICSDSCVYVYFQFTYIYIYRVI